jgi:dTMP kinase
MNHLIAIDGDEFTGKTTVVIPALAVFLEKKGYVVKTSREPGGSPKGEKMREEIFEKLRQGISPYEQAVLFNKARKNHIDEVIKPFLDSGDKRVVLLDRYLDSTVFIRV